MLDSAEIAERLRVAVRAVQEAEVPDPLRDAAFERALTAAGLPTVPGPGQSSAGGPPRRVDAASSQLVGAQLPGDVLRRIAQTLKLEPDDVACVYGDENGELE